MQHAQARQILNAISNAMCAHGEYECLSMKALETPLSAESLPEERLLIQYPVLRHHRRPCSPIRLCYCCLSAVIHPRQRRLTSWGRSHSSHSTFHVRARNHDRAHRVNRRRCDVRGEGAAKNVCAVVSVQGMGAGGACDRGGMFAVTFFFFFRRPPFADRPPGMSLPQIS